MDYTAWRGGVLLGCTDLPMPSYVVLVQDVTDAPDAGSASRPPA